MKKISFKTKAGFTIIETMIAVSLFIIIVMMGMGALLNANALHQKSQNMRSILDNLSFTMEDMSRNLRTGAYYYCITTGIPPVSAGVGYTQSCQNGGGGISFQSTSGAGGQWVYYVGVNPNNRTYSIFKSFNGTTVQLTPDEIEINSSAPSFIVIGAEPPNPDGLGDHQQPFVTIKLVGTITSNNITTPFSLQTSVSQRQIDI